MALKLRCRTPFLAWGGLCALVTLVSAGCGPDEGVHAYDTSKPPPPVQRILNRIIGAFFDTKDATWSFKFVGPEPVVKEHEDDIRNFLHSLRFAGDAPIYKAPEEWKPAPNVPGRHAAFLIGPKEKQIELTIVKVDPDGLKDQKILDNINRWRLQLDLMKVDLATAQDSVTELNVDGARKGAYIDHLVGPGSGKTQAGMAMPGMKRPKPTVRGEAFAYVLPEKWNELGPDAAPKDQRLPTKREAAFEVVDGRSSALITIISFPGDVGGLARNIDRWAGEVGIGKMTQEQMIAVTKEATVAGEDAAYVDLLGPDGAERKRTLVVMVPHNGKTWFIKMMGPAELVGREKERFDAFLKTLKFQGGR